MNNQQELSLIRIIYFTTQFYLIGLNKFFPMWKNVPLELWRPHGLLIFFPELFIQNHFSVLILIWQLSFIFCILGLFYRLNVLLNLSLGTIIIGYCHGFGTYFHIYMPIILCNLILAFSPANLCFSLDKLFWKKNSSQIDNIFAKLSIFNVKMIICLVYFSAGISKLINGGISWVYSDTLRNYFVGAFLNYPDINYLPRKLALSRYLYEWPLICKILAGLTILFELTLPLALFKRFRYYILTFVVFQISVYFLLYLSFMSFFVIFSVWLPALIAPLLTSKFKNINE